MHRIVPSVPRRQAAPRTAWLSVARQIAWLVWASASAVAPAAAHPLPFSYLDLRLDPRGSTAFSGSLTVHVYDAARELAIEPPERLIDEDQARARQPAFERLLEARLAIAGDGRPLHVAWGPIQVLRETQSLRLPFVLEADGTPARAPGVVSLSTALFPYDPNHQTFVNVYDGSVLRRQAILDARRPSFEYFSGSSHGIRAVVERFVAAGIHHILIGPDHILFLVGLLLLGGSMRRLLLVVTAFTVAHSLTLSLAALNVLAPPPRVVEPLIALSIVYVGVDNLLIKEGRDVRAWIAFGFGLVHGFGFAGVLREMDLPAGALAWSLFSFNVGVEIGQLLVVVLVASALAALRHRSEAAGRRIAFAGSLVVVIAGTFWFVQRVFFAGGNL